MSIRLTLFSLTCFTAGLHAQGTGPYPPAAGQPGSTAVPHDDGRIVAWANEVVSYEPGKGVSDIFDDPGNALNAAGNNTISVVSLGEGGTITLSFQQPITDGPGPDFAVFENAISNNNYGFLELAFVEVSSTGEEFVRFPSSYLGTEAISANSTRGDATLIQGLAGKYKVGFGTPFDLATLRGKQETAHLDFDDVRYVRIVDIIGDGSAKDTVGNAIFDPYTEGYEFGTNGFDLDGIAVLNSAQPVLEDPVYQAEKITLTWSLPSAGQWILQQSTDLQTWTDVEIHIADQDSFTLDVPASTAPVFYRLSRP